MAEQNSLNDLIEGFFKKGGKINRYYLRDINRSRRSLVYLHGWFSGDNVRTAIMKALGK